MGLFSGDIIEKDPCNGFLKKLLERHSYEYWQERPQETLETIFEFIVGIPIKHFNDNNGNEKEGMENMKFIENTIGPFIKDYFKWNGTIGYQLCMYCDKKSYDKNGVPIHYNKKNPDNPLWMQPYVSFIFIKSE
jgi:hypothetical protein